MSPHPSRSTLEAFARGADAGPPALRDHAAACAACAGVLDEFREEDEALRELLDVPPAEPGDEFLRRIRNARPMTRRALGWREVVAAAAAAAVLLALLLSPARDPVRVLEGALTLADGRRLEAPAVIEALPKGILRTAERGAVVRLPGGAVVDLGPRTWAHAEEVGKRELKGLLEGDPDVIPPGTLVTVISGALSVRSAAGLEEVPPGRPALLAGARAPMFLRQESLEALQERLDALEARIEELQWEVRELEEEGEFLKDLKREIDGRNVPKEK